MTQRDEARQRALPEQATEGINTLTHEVWAALEGWNSLLAPFWQTVHLDHPESETKEFSDALAEYTYAYDIAGVLMEDGKTLAALAHLADALGAVYKMVKADGSPYEANG